MLVPCTRRSAFPFAPLRSRGQARRYPVVAGAKGYHARPTPLVERGGTLTFSAWASLFPTGTALPRAHRLRVVPLPAPTATPAPGATDNTPGAAARPGLFPRLSAGLALVGWGSQPAQLTDPTPTPATQVWLRYRVLDEAGQQVAEHYEYQATDNAPTADPWRQLRTAVRVQQGGTVEVALGSDDPAWQAYFDDLRLEQTGSLIVQEQHQYAYGSPLVGLNYAVGTKRYRYGYQGQFAEQDAETGFESFELRLYNDRIGRWTSNDPEGQYSSPYVGMGNNPVSSVDPDGGTGVPVNIGTSTKLMGKVIDTYLLSTCNLANVAVSGSRLASIGLQALNYAGQAAQWYGRYANGTFQGEEAALKSTANFIGGLGWGENHSYQQLHQGVEGLGHVMLASPSEKVQMMVQAGESAVDYVKSVPDMTPEEFGNDVGLAGGGYAIGEVTFGAIRGGNINIGNVQLSFRSSVTAPGMSGRRVLGVKVGRYTAALDNHNWVMRSARDVRAGRGPINQKFWHYHFGRSNGAKPHMQLGTGRAITDASQLRDIGIFGWW